MSDLSEAAHWKNLEQEIGYREFVAAFQTGCLGRRQSNGDDRGSKAGLPRPVLSRVLGEYRPFLNEVPLLPFGFRSAEAYVGFVTECHRLLRENGQPHVLVAIRGGGATGFSYGTGRVFDDDCGYELAVVGRSLFDQAKTLERSYSTDQRTCPIRERSAVAYGLGLNDLLTALRGIARRDISLIILRDLAALAARGPFTVLE